MKLEMQSCDSLTLRKDRLRDCHQVEVTIPYMCMATVIRYSIPMVSAAFSSLLLFMSRFVCVLYGEVSSAVMSRIIAVTAIQRRALVATIRNLQRLHFE